MDFGKSTDSLGTFLEGPGPKQETPVKGLRVPIDRRPMNTLKAFCRYRE